MSRNSTANARVRVSTREADDALWMPIQRGKLQINCDARPVSIRRDQFSLEVSSWPLGWLKAEGQSVASDDRLSIATLLEALGAREAANAAFPWVKANTSHWFVFLLASLPGKRPLTAVRRFLDDPGLRASVGARGKGGTTRFYTWDAHRVPDEKIEAGGFLSEWRRLAGRVHTQVIRRREEVAPDIARKFREKFWVRQSDVLLERVTRKKRWGEWLCELTDTDRDGIDRAANKFVERCRQGNAPTQFRKLAGAYAAIRALYGEDLSGGSDKAEIKRWAELSLGIIAKLSVGELPQRLIDHLHHARQYGQAPLLTEAVRIRAKKKTPVYQTFRLWLFLNHCRKLNRAIKREE